MTSLSLLAGRKIVLIYTIFKSGYIILKKLCAQCTYMIKYGIQKNWVMYSLILQILSEDFELARATINVRGQGDKSFISTGAFVKRYLLTNLLQLLLLECT